MNSKTLTNIDTDDNAIEINGLQFSYDKMQTLINIGHWQVQSKSQLFLYGPSGSGKSTLLNLLSGILTPQQGEIRLLGQAFSQLSTRQRDRFRAEHIGVVFQEFNLIPFLTVWENIYLARHFSKKNTLAQDSEQYAKVVFERLQLSKALLNRRADALSVGQRQRASIARALINQPEILIADEPTSALDTANRDEFMRLLLQSGEQSGCTVLFVSHDQGLRCHFSHHQDIGHLLAGANNVI